MAVEICKENIPFIPEPLVIAGFVSGNGTSIRRVVEEIEAGRLEAKVGVLIISDPHSSILEFAQKHNIPTAVINKETEGNAQLVDEKITQTLADIGINLFILSGYIPLIGPLTLAACPGINIHPSLLPAYGGKGMYKDKVHAAVLQAGEKESGATAHLVDATLDTGRVLARQRVPVESTDDVHSLQKRVAEVEPEVVITAIQAIIERRTQAA